jgi:hypothetical protein
LPSGTTVSGIDFTLDGGGVIAGKVTEAATGDPLAEIKIEIWDAAGRTISSGVTDASGEYAARGLPTGTYFVTTENFLGFIDEIYDDLQCPGSAARFNCFPTGGVPVEAAVGATTVGIDFTLDRLSAMSGTVVAETSGQPIPSYIMELFTARAPSTRSSMTFPAPTGRASTAFATSSREPWWRCNPQP